MKNGKQKSVCFYFQVHQPLRLSKLRFFDIEDGSNSNYFDGLEYATNEFFIKKVGTKSYHPVNNLILKLLEKYKEFRVSYSISGITLDQFEMYDPSLITSFQKLVKTKQVEILGETYYHSLSWLYSKEEFVKQVLLHRSKIWDIFKKRPKVFRNTELIYNNELGNFMRNLGYTGIIAEGWDKYLGGRSPNFVYKAPKFNLSKEDAHLVNKYKFIDTPRDEIGLLLKNYKLSDDIAFRFSNSDWADYPLDADKFANWVASAPGETVNLFMDYETFGEHQWEDSGIFEFLKALPEALLSRGITFKTPSETLSTYDTKDIIDMHDFVSWADIERDTSAWLGNKMQREAAKLVYECESLVSNATTLLPKVTKDHIYTTWRRLQTSDHFYYMSTKYWSDGDIHKYFSPYDSPYDAYINYMNVLNNFRVQLEKR